MKKAAGIFASIVFASLAAQGDFKMYPLTTADKIYFEQIQKTVLADDVETFAKMVSYPLIIRSNKETLKIEKAADVKNDEKKLFTPQVKAAVQKQVPDSLFKNWRGVMVGNGAIWFSQVAEKTSAKDHWVYRIIGMNPDRSIEAKAGTKLAQTNAQDQIEESLSPNRSLRLSIEELSSAGRKLVLVSEPDKMALAKIPLPDSLASLRSPSTKSSILWKQDNTGVAVSVSDSASSRVYACVELAEHGFKWIDVSGAEGVNLGVLGRPRSDFIQVEHTPTRWRNATEDSPQLLWIRTRFWDKARKRCTVEQEVAIWPSGKFGWK